MPTDEAPLCQCGCGEQVQSRTRGVWSRWRPGHSRRPVAHVSEPPPEVLGTQLSMLPDEAPEFPLPYGAKDEHA